MNFRLAAGDRAVFIGLPRSGKTNLIAALLQGVKSFVVIDSKRHPDEWVAWAKANGILVTSDPAEINRRLDDKGALANPRIIFQITSRALGDRGGWDPNHKGSPGNVWTQALEAIISRGRRYSTIVVFDEVIQTLPAGASHPAAWEIYTQGRAFGVSCWAGSQIANRMDTLVIRLAEHCFAFWMGNRKEQELLAQARGIDCSVLSSLELHHFAYQQVGPRSAWTVCQPVPYVLKKGDSGHRVPKSERKPAASRSEQRDIAEPAQPVI